MAPCQSKGSRGNFKGGCLGLFARIVSVFVVFQAVMDDDVSSGPGQCGSRNDQNPDCRAQRRPRCRRGNDGGRFRLIYRRDGWLRGGLGGGRLRRGDSKDGSPNDDRGDIFSMLDVIAQSPAQDLYIGIPAGVRDLDAIAIGEILQGVRQFGR